MSNYDAIEANIKRYAHKALADAAALWTPAVPVRDSDIRAPFNPSLEDEAIIFRFITVRRQNSRTDVWEGVVGFEAHCMTKRGDLRTDGKKDRHLVIAGLVQKVFRADISVYASVEGNTKLYLGALQGLQTGLHFRDKRNTIFGADVDYSVETPNTLQAVVSVTGLFCTSI